MRVRDSRPPFAGLANLSEEQLHRLPTPCYLLDEAQLRRNGEILLGVQQRTGCRSCWRRRLFPTSTSTRCWHPIWRVPRPAACTRAAWAGKSCRRRRTMCSARPTGPMSLTSCCNTPTTSCSTRPASWQSSARRQRRRAKASVCASTRSAPRRRATKFMTPAPPAAAWAPPAPSGTPPWRRTPGAARLLDGLHFHTLCEQDADALAVTLAAVEEKFGDLLPG